METAKQLYTLEFSERDKTFRISDEPSGGNYITLTEYCSPFEHRVFSCYLSRTNSELTSEYVVRSYTELKEFWRKLTKYGLGITEG